MRKITIFFAIFALFITALFSGSLNRYAPVQAEEASAVQQNASLPDNTVVMYIGSGRALVNDEETQIIAGEQAVAPYLKNGSAFVPIRFIADGFGVDTDWSAETNTAVISGGGVRLFVTEGSRELISEQGGKTAVILMSTAAERKDGRLCVPARYIVEALGKEVFYDSGLIIISKDALSVSANKDRVYLDKLIASFTGLERVGSKERLIELLGISDEEIVYDRWADGASNGGGAGAATTELRQNATSGAPMPAPAAPSAQTSASQKDSIAFQESAVASDSGEAEYSQTNLQVEGVDEADIIKTDGDYIYYVRGNKIEIVRAYADGKLEQSSQIVVDEGFSFSEIFVDKNRIVAIGSSFSGGPYLTGIMPVEAEIAVSRYPFYGGEQFSKAVVYNTSDKKNPKEERVVEIKGYYSSSRKIDDSVYFISSSYIHYGALDNAAPTYRDSASGGRDTAVGWDRVYCFPVIMSNNLTTIAGFNLNEPETPASIESFLGAGGEVYMSENNLYMANPVYHSGNQQTEIYKFAASDGKITFSSKGVVPGNLINQFAMDEYNGYFRTGTTVYDYSAVSGQSRQYNCLYVLDGSMNIVGKIENIAPEERIYSVRFMGNRAYMVTFKQVDPLFAIDVSNPREPKTMGALKIPGYSDYLHPYDENHLIGFGKDTTLDRYGNAFYLGMKVSLFDITDMSNPKEMFVEYIGDRGTDSPLLSDHKALLFSKEKNLLAFPINLFETNKNSAGGNLEYGSFSGSYAYVYSISLADGFKLRGRISHLSDEDTLKTSQWGGDYEKYIDRILYIGKQLYTSSKAMLTSSDYDSLEEVDRLIFR